MVEWQDMTWQCLLQELKYYHIDKSYKLTHQKGFVFLIIDNDEGYTYMFDMCKYAGETNEEIAKNIAKDIAKNYLT